MTLRMALLFPKTTADSANALPSTTAGTKFLAVPLFQMAEETASKRLAIALR